MGSFLLKVLVVVGVVSPFVLTNLVPRAGLNTENEPEIVWREEQKEQLVNVAAPTKRSASIGIDLSARVAIVIDVDSGATLFEKNADASMSLASITKLATMLVFLQHNPGFDAIANLEPEDDAEGGKLYVDTTDTMTVRDLFYTSLVGSANNTTNALARLSGLAPADFVVAMNDLARGLDLTATSFVEPTGLSARNISSARDVATLAQYAFNNTDIADALQSDAYIFRTLNTNKVHTIDSTNEVLNLYPWKEKTIGKTGFINEAGFCLVAHAERDEGHPIIVVVLDARDLASRFNEVKGLIEWTFDAYSWPGEGGGGS